MAGMRFDPVLFDLDGTLIDSGLDIALSVNAALARLALSALPVERIVSMVGDGVRKLMERALAAAGRAEDLDRAVAIFREQYQKMALNHTRPYPGVKEMLEKLDGGSVGVVTNKPAEFARQVLQGLGLARFVGCVVGGDETEKLKPDPQPLLLACRRLGKESTTGIMVGDYANDILAARAAGMKSCAVLWGFAGSEAALASGPDFVCHDVKELVNLLCSVA